MNDTVPHDAARILSTLRDTQKNAVHRIVGDLAAPLAASTMEALNITPSFTHDPREVSDFVGAANAVLIQLSIMSDTRESGLMTAIDLAITKHKPWVLETRFASKSIFRAQLARRLAGYKPSIICGISRDLGTMQRSGSVADMPKFVKVFKTTAVCLGPRDHVADQFHEATVENHSAHMDNIGAMNCAVAALCTAFCIVEHNEFKAAAAATLVGRITGKRAERDSAGPGTFTAGFIDALYSITPEEILYEARVFDGLV